MAIVQNIIAFLAVSCVISGKICASANEEKWKEFKVTHNKQYETSEHESLRKQVFMERLKQIEAHNENYNKGLVTYTVGINKYSDMSYEEIKQNMGMRHVPRDPNVPVFYESGDDLPTEVDWRNHSAVVGIKDQGYCGSSYAFSAVCALEGQNAIKNKKLVSLSEKNILDCSLLDGNNGCNGGLMTYSFDYIRKNGGIDTEESYPYDDIVDNCTFTKEGIGATCTGYKYVNKSEKALLEAVAKIGPISVAISVVTWTFANYKSGIFADTQCAGDLNLGVAIVGYGTEKDVDYWIVKNSFGESWGEKGYMRMWRGNNLCYIQDEAIYPLM